MNAHFQNDDINGQSPSAAYLENDGDSQGIIEHGRNNSAVDGESNQEEEFVPDPNLQTLDLSGQYIDDLEPLIMLVFAKMLKLRELNLSNNMISSLPTELCRSYLPYLESINLNGNQIPQEEDQFSQVVEALSLIGQNNPNLDGSSHSAGLGGLKVLFISLTREDQVDFILRKLPRLEFLNGLAVDRDELYSSQEAACDDGQQVESDGNDRYGEESKGEDGNNSIVEVMERQHEMFEGANGGSGVEIQNSSQQEQSFQDHRYHDKQPSESREDYLNHQREDRDERHDMEQHHLIDDEDLVNAKAQETEISNKSRHEQHQIRFDADQYGSFAANDNRQEEEQEDEQDQQENDFAATPTDNSAEDQNNRHQRESSRRIEHNDDNNDSQSATQQDGNGRGEAQTSSERKQEQVDHGEDEQDEEDADIELFDVNLCAEESDDQQDQRLNDEIAAFGGGQDTTEGINTDEFEHIAEIYDQIRMLHQQYLFTDRTNQGIKTQIDRNLASYFDTKLKKVMEELAMSQNTDPQQQAANQPGQNHQQSEAKLTLSNNLKREMSQRSIYQLYMVCAEKIIGLALKDNQEIANVIIQIFKGLSKIQGRYKHMILGLNQKHSKALEDLERNQIETQQVLEAAEHLEQSNATNQDKVSRAEQQNKQLLQQIAQLEHDRDQKDAQIQQLQQLYSQQRAALESGQIPSPQSVQTHGSQRQFTSSSQKQQQQQLNNQQQQRHQQINITNGTNQIQGQGQAQPTNLDFPLQMVGQQPQKQGVNRPHSAIKTPTPKQQQNQQNANMGISQSMEFSVSAPPQQPAEMQTFQPSAMSARGLPLAQPGFIKSQQSSTVNFTAGSQSQRSITPSSSSGLAGGGNKRATSGKFFGKNPTSISQANSRSLTLKQLRDLINDIYQQKTKFDQKCEESRLPRETMEQFMYTYLNQRYGLKNLIIEWAAAIITGIKQYQKDDHDVALFGKILRSECDEEFRFIQQTVKETVIALLRALFRERNPQKSENTLITMVENVLSGKSAIENWQWRRIIEKMYDEEDYKLLESQLNQRLIAQQSEQSSQKSGRGTGDRQISGRIRSSSSNLMGGQGPPGRKPLTRSAMQNMQQNPEASKLKFSVFLKCVLDFQLKEHEKFLGYFVQMFKRADVDRDGILTENEFRNLMLSVGFSQETQNSGDFHVSRIEKFLQEIDPYSNQKITFSECVQLLSSETVTVPSPESLHHQLQQQMYPTQELDGYVGNDLDYVEVAILEHLSQANPHVGTHSVSQSHASGMSTPVMSNR